MVGVIIFVLGTIGPLLGFASLELANRRAERERVHSAWLADHRARIIDHPPVPARRINTIGSGR